MGEWNWILIVELCFFKNRFRNGPTAAGQPAGNDGTGWGSAPIEYAATNTSSSGAVAAAADAEPAEYDGWAAVLAPTATLLRRKRGSGG